MNKNTRLKIDGWTLTRPVKDVEEMEILSRCVNYSIIIAVTILFYKKKMIQKTNGGLIWMDFKFDLKIYWIWDNKLNNSVFQPYLKLITKSDDRYSFIYLEKTHTPVVHVEVLDWTHDLLTPPTCRALSRDCVVYKKEIDRCGDGRCACGATCPPRTARYYTRAWSLANNKQPHEHKCTKRVLHLQIKLSHLKSAYIYPNNITKPLNG